MKKELILGFAPDGNGESIFPFDDVFAYKQNMATGNFDLIDVFVLWGGTDIHPSLYNCKPHMLNGAPNQPSKRDIFEWKAIQTCIAKNIPIIGVCRGAQMLCAAAGGKLIQHVNGHARGDHRMVTKDGLSMLTTSAHHQMMDLEGTTHELIAWADGCLSNVYYGESSRTPEHIVDKVAKGKFVEPEIVYFPTLNALAIQGHPEWSDKKLPFVQLCNELIEEYLLVKETV